MILLNSYGTPWSVRWFFVERPLPIIEEEREPTVPLILENEVIIEIPSESSSEELKPSLA